MVIGAHMRVISAWDYLEFVFPHAALPFEYLDEHDDFNYDLDTAQSQAKYDARLLSQQMLSEAELQQQRAEAGHDDGLDTDSTRAQGIPSASGTDPVGSAEEEELEPHSRAAACFTNGHKYTHGQKVKRNFGHVCVTIKKMFREAFR